MMAEHRHPSTHLERLQQLYTVIQRLMASRSPGHDELRAALQSIVEINAAHVAGLLLVDAANQPGRFVQVGLSPDARPGPRSAALSPQDLPIVYSAPGPWSEFLLPGAQQVHSCIAVAITAGERVGGYLALARQAEGEPFTPQDLPFLQILATHLGVILENARLLQTAQQRADQMETLYRVGLATNASLDMDAVLVSVYEQCCKVMNVDAFYVALYEPEEHQVAYPIFVDHGQRLDPFRLPLDSGLAGWIVQNQQPFCCDDTVAEIENLPIRVNRTGGQPTRSYLGMPIVRRERIIGVLSVQSYQVAAYGDADVQLLTMLAAQAAVAIENASLFRETQQELIEAAVLSEVSQGISSKLTREDLLPYLAQSLARILDASGCFIVIRNPRTGELQLAATFGPHKAAYERLKRGRGDFFLDRAVIEAMQPIAVTDVGDGRYIATEIAQQLPDQALLGLPLVVQGQAVGAAIVGESRQRRRFSEREIERALVVANQAAVAITNARLFREAEQRLVELGMLAEISRVISSLLQPSDVYRRVVDELAHAFGYPFVAFYRVEGRGLELAAQVGYRKGHLPVYIPRGHGPIGDAAATGQTTYAPDVRAIPNHKPAAKGVVSQIAMPLRKDERVLGVLCVENYDTLTEVDLSLLQSLSYQISTAIENDRLYAAEQREREVAGILLQIAGDLSGTLDLDEVLDLILERLRTVVPYESAAIGLLSGDVYYLAAAHDLPRAERLWGAGRSPDELPLVARVLRRQTAIVIADTRQLADWVITEGGEHIRSWLGVPLMVKERTIGLLMLNHATPAFYDQHAVRLALAFAQHAAVAIENARLYEQAQSKLDEQTLLYEMTTAVSSTLDAGRILRLLAERLVAVLGVTSTRIATFDQEVRVATPVVQHLSADASKPEKRDGLGEAYLLAAFPFTQEALTKRQPLPITIENAPDEWHERMAQRSGQALLILPLVARDRVTGFVELWDSRSQRRFSETEVALAQTLINQVAVAVDNAHLFAETQRRLNELTLLYDVAVTAASTLELDTILQSVVKTLQFRVLEGATVSVLLLDEESLPHPGQDEGRPELRLRAHAGELEGVTHQAWSSLADVFYDQVLQAGQPVLIGDASQDPRCASYSPVVRSILCVPLAWGQRVVGVLQAFSAQQDAFSGHDQRLLHIMAGSLAIAIENVRLFTELKLSEEALTFRNQALKRANERLQELDRLKSSFIASVSHDLRTPLNSIIGFSEVLMDGLTGELPPLAQEYLSYIHGSGKHLLDLINGILDLSKIQAGRVTLELDRVDVIAVLDDVRATLAPLVAKKDQTLNIEQGEPLPEIVADRSHLKRILLNLMGNATKFTQDGGQITARAHLSDLDTLQIDVIDNGPGIPVQDRSLIFEEFRQAHVARPPGEGTGLGLAITRRLVELHGGHIWVESELDVGSTFTVLLPVVGPEPGKNIEGAAEAAPDEEENNVAK
jgi:GAF domain-containing protein